MRKLCQRRPGVVRVISLVLAAGAVAAVSWAQDVETAPGLPRPVIAIRVDSIIHPPAATFVTESLAEAESLDAAAFVIELGTPGGLLTSTREIFTAMLGSAVPVVVYVSPSGSQAASAGFFILMAAALR